MESNKINSQLFRMLNSDCNNKKKREQDMDWSWNFRKCEQEKLHWKKWRVMSWFGVGRDSHQYLLKEWKSQKINFYLQFKNEKSVRLIITLFFHSGSYIYIYCPHGTKYAHSGQFLFTDSILNVRSSQAHLTTSYVVQSRWIEIINNNFILMFHFYCTKYAKRYHSLSGFYKITSA